MLNSGLNEPAGEYIFGPTVITQLFASYHEQSFGMDFLCYQCADDALYVVTVLQKAELAQLPLVVTRVHRIDCEFLIHPIHTHHH